MTKKSRVKYKCPKCDYVFLPTAKEKQARVGASSRRKGANFERNVAKKLKAWWPGDHDFKRTPQSGGSALKEGWDLAGDIATTAKDFFWHIECKNAPGSFQGWHQFFTSTKFKIWEWLDQAEKDRPDDKEIMLIVNRFDQPTWCVSISNVPLLIRLSNAKINYLHYHRHMIQNDMGLIIWTLDDMLKSDPEIWK